MFKRILFTSLIAVMTGLCVVGCGGVSGSECEEVHIEADEIRDAADGGSEDTDASEPVANSCGDLSVPTQITRIGDLYFIVDCYHNQVIYHDNLTDPIWQWNVMTSDISMGHTVAGDGEVYLVDDTENNRVLVFEYDGVNFINTQTFNNIGNRPHYIVYNEADSSFYAWSSMTGEMYVFTHDSEQDSVYISRIMKIDALDGVYVRSFTIDGDSIYLVSGNSTIIEAGLDDFKIKKTYDVPDSMAGMIQIMPVESGYYITISTDVNGNQDFATIVYAKELSALADGGYTDIYDYFVGGGTPYYMGYIDGKYYLTEHRLPGHAVWSFDIGEDGMPLNVTAVY